MGTNKCASQAGMNAYGTRRHLYDPKSHILPPMDHSTISLQMGTNKGASQVSTTPHDIAHFLLLLSHSDPYCFCVSFSLLEITLKYK